LADAASAAGYGHRVLLARFARFLSRFRRIQPKVGRIQAAVIRLSRGRIRRSFMFAGGQTVLVLTTTGRRSGQRRSTTVAYVRHGDAYAVDALNLGSDRTPAWCLNLRADPRAWIEVDGGRREVRGREAAGEEAELLWARFIERLPMIEHSRRLARRDVAMIVLDPV
jgi:deazaflavin-dependent oxidoreductase (nitroreductase family)